MAKKNAVADGGGEAMVVGVALNGTHSLKLFLDDGTELIALVAGGKSNAENAKNRDVLKEALERTLHRALPEAS
jgi:hypothetical protein